MSSKTEKSKLKFFKFVYFNQNLPISYIEQNITHMTPKNMANVNRLKSVLFKHTSPEIVNMFLLNFHLH